MGAKNAESEIHHPMGVGLGLRSELGKLMRSSGELNDQV